MNQRLPADARRPLVDRVADDVGPQEALLALVPDRAFAEIEPVRDLVERQDFVDSGHEGTALIGRGGEPAARFFQRTSRVIGEDLIAAGVISRDEFNERQAAYDDPTFSFVTMSSFGAWARRPAARRGDD